ncbi:MAG: IMP dehydrogenase, partial [Phycisphaerae bacterium]
MKDKLVGEGITFDDVLLVPARSSVLPRDVDTSTRLTRQIRQLASVAHQLGRRTLCEAYGVSGWDSTFEHYKRMGDWLLVHGINLIDQLVRIPGIAQVNVFGAGQYAMRLWVKPD